MSEATLDPTVAHAHPPHLAHHFETPQQQYASAKLGMWVFLGTEILMFGGLFCAYAVYRHNHPEVFVFAHQALDKTLGGINTAVLITSSLTMAMAVRYAQLGRRAPLMLCLALTIVGGAGFMVIKSVEYHKKWELSLFPGKYNVYNKDYKGTEKPPEDLEALEHGGKEEGAANAADEAVAAPTTAPTGIAYADPLAGTTDEPKIKPPFIDSPGLAPQHRLTPAHALITYRQLNPIDQQRVNTFFSMYFMMTGLHGLHVLVGMALITWILIRASKGVFGPSYFTPVDLVGLYWHLVDLIWIFLFPLLYLIH